MAEENMKTRQPAQTKISLSDFCDMKEFEKILSDWSVTTDMSAIVRDMDHQYITEKYGFSQYCLMMQTSEAGSAKCRSCENDANLFSCHAGLCDFSLPVTLPDGQTIAYVFCGQVKLPESEKPDLNKLAAEYQLDAEKLCSEYENIKVKSREKIEAAKALLSSSVNSFVAKSYAKWISKNESQDDRTLSQITQILYAYNLTLDLGSGRYTLIEGTGLDWLRSVYKKNIDYQIAQNEASRFVHPGYAERLNNLLNIVNLRNYAGQGHIDTFEYPVIYPGANDYEWHEVNVFISRDNQGKSIVNILGRDVTEAHNLQEKNNREIRAAAAKNQILSDLTKMLYSYNITLNLNSGKYTLIEGTGMTIVREIFKSTDDYPTAYAKKTKLILPEYTEQFGAIASMEALRGHRNNHGFIGSLEYGTNADKEEEWHEVNVFISTDELGNPVANILGRDITEAHKRQEQREIAQKAAAARDQLLSGVTKMLYSFNITVNMNSWKYSLITGTGCDEALEIMQACDDAVLTFNRLRNMLDEESKEKIDRLLGMDALKSYRNRSGFIGTVTTSAMMGGRKQWQEINLFMSTNEYGEPTANVLGRDITEAQLRQEEKENELKASAAKDQILSEITKSLYSFNITINLVTGKYSLITGTGMDDYVAFLMATDDYGLAYERALVNVQPEYIDTYKGLVSIDYLRKKASVNNGHVGQLEYAAYGKDGTEWHEVNVFISSNENGEPLANLLGRDVTETHMAQERRENELRAVAAKDQILSEITKTLYSYNLTLNLITGKYSLIRGTGMENFVQIFESTDDYETAFTKKIEYVSDSYKEAFGSFSGLAALRERTEEKGYIGNLEYSADDGTGLEWHEINVFIGTNENGDPIANILGRDITEAHDRADTKAKLEIAEASSRSKTQFLFNMSHDIRTPMNAIIGFTDLLQKHLDDKEMAENYISKIKYSNEFLLSLINNVLEMARIESGKETLDETLYDAQDFNDSIGVVFDAQMKEKGISFSRSIKVEHSSVLCDGTKLREIFLNLLSNALKYTPAGGKVRMDTVELPSKMPGYVLYKTVVSDTGIGMSKEFLPHLFEEFSRERNTTESKIMGTGLGMPIVKNLVDLMHGTIEVESELGKGSTFTVILPHRIAQEQTDAMQLEQDNLADDISFEGKRILLAEDNDLNAEIATEILSEVGFEIERAADGIICVDMLQKAPENYYDVILMDIQMPNMDGYKATQVIRAMSDNSRNNIPIVAMTANAFEEDKRNALAVGMNGHVAKPIEIPKLMETLAGILK